MNIYDPYPTEVEVDGKTYQLNLAYDRVLMVMDIQNDSTLTDIDKQEVQCALLLAGPVPRDPYLRAEILNAIFALFPHEEGESGERYIDFHQDAAMIRSAFFRIGVDLTKQKIHYLQFLELLCDLPSDTALMRTIELRQRPIPKLTPHNREYVADLQKAKARVAIRLTEEEQRAAFAMSIKKSSLMRG